MAEVTQPELMRVDAHSNPKDLTGALLDLLFTAEELATGNATKARNEGISLLDSSKLNAIRGKHCWLMLPCTLPKSCILSLPVLGFRETAD